LKVGIDAFFQVFGLADVQEFAFGIEKSVHPGLVGQGFQLFAQSGVAWFWHSTKIGLRKADFSCLGKAFGRLDFRNYPLFKRLISV
jgi:hypothetical protein